MCNIAFLPVQTLDIGFWAAFAPIFSDMSQIVDVEIPPDFSTWRVYVMWTSFARMAQFEQRAASGNATKDKFAATAASILPNCLNWWQIRRSRCQGLKLPVADMVIVGCGTHLLGKNAQTKQTLWEERDRLPNANYIQKQYITPSKKLQYQITLRSAPNMQQALCYARHRLGAWLARVVERGPHGGTAQATMRVAKPICMGVGMEAKQKANS